MNKTFKTLSLLLLVLASSCLEPQDDAPEVKMVTHDGLSFAVPKGRVVTLEGHRITLGLAGLQRATDEIVIWTSAPPPLPLGEVSEGSDPEPHTMIAIEGGMGGPEYVLSLTKPMGNRTISLRAYTQLETGQPRFTDAWIVWRSLRL